MQILFKFFEQVHDNFNYTWKYLSTLYDEEIQDVFFDQFTNASESLVRDIALQICDVIMKLMPAEDDSSDEDDNAASANK